MKKKTPKVRGESKSCNFSKSKWGGEQRQETRMIIPTNRCVHIQTYRELLQMSLQLGSDFLWPVYLGVLPYKCRSFANQLLRIPNILF